MTLVNSLINSKSFENPIPWDFLKKKSCYLQIQFFFLSNPSNVFISFSSLIVVAGVPSTMLNKNGENPHPYLFPVLGRKQSFTTKYDVRCRWWFTTEVIRLG